MQDDMNKRLVNLLKRADSNAEMKGITDYDDMIQDCADFLIANGVIAPPCKVGDTVYTNIAMQGWYMRKKNRPYKAKIVFIGVNNVDNFMNVVFENDNMIQFNFSQIGKTVFLAKEKAEKALKEREVK